MTDQIKMHVGCAIFAIILGTLFTLTIMRNCETNDDPVVQKVTAEALHDAASGKLARPNAWGK